MDGPSREVLIGGRSVSARLSPKEFDLLRYLYERRGETCSREELGEALWGSADVSGKHVPKYDDHMLHALVHRARGKLRRAGVDLSRYVSSISGIGYRLDATPHPAAEGAMENGAVVGTGARKRAPAIAAGALAGLFGLGLAVFMMWGQSDNNAGNADASPTPIPAAELCGAEMISPEPGSTLPGSTVTFEWTPGCGMIKYDMWIGCAPGANDFFDAEDGVFFEATVSDLPVDGGPVHVFLISHNGTDEGLFIQKYVYTARPDDGSTVVTVTGPGAWMDTGIDIKAPQGLSISACGQLRVNTTGNPSFKADGNVECPGAWRYGFPAPTLPCWSLIGRMDQGEPFLVGTSFQAPAGSLSGRLYLGLNDDNPADNSGAFRATIHLSE